VTHCADDISVVDSPKKIKSNLKEKITTAIAEMVVKDYLPLSFVEGDYFFNLMNIIVPEYKVQLIIKQTYKEVTVTITCMINNQRQIRLKCKLLIRKQHNHCTAPVHNTFDFMSQLFVK
jgi:hypothetical protein